MTLGLHHEQQHQELILMDIKHVLSCNPALWPAYRAPGEAAPAARTRADASAVKCVGETRWASFDGGEVAVGHDDCGFAFDNEGPRHRVLTEPFRLAECPVTCAQWLEFIADGGYETSTLWLADGWGQRLAHGWEAPSYWHLADDGWQVFTLEGLKAVAPDEPVCHLSYYEADAFARWAGARLPTEFEWEHAAVGLPRKGNIGSCAGLHPVPAKSPTTALGNEPVELQQMYGDVWEWTSHVSQLLPPPHPLALLGPASRRRRLMTHQDAAAPAAVEPVIDNWLDAGWADRELRADVSVGLSSSPKELPPKWFYDERGSELFDQITRLDEYYPTRREREILEREADAIVTASGADCLAELGSGTSTKTRILLDAFATAGQLRRYVPFDNSAATLRNAATELVQAYPRLRVHGVVGAMQTGDTFLLGTDLVKDADRLVAAYDDAAGVTAQFNLNVLSVLNRRLGADFDLDAFEHEAVFDAGNEWIEMRLHSTRAQRVHIPALEMTVDFARRERMRTELSAKFRPERVRAELDAVGLVVQRMWTDDDGDYALTLARRVRRA
ncbi:L-histidine N(alpha)-methyltransferase [Candidatus Poriferisodalis sp.]|uniref:L-histidine N(alpha)-methyltransferase n=1 Tax=Candidatus Poriferisodalis sp. TaxID=3101277 RepID=UPI003B515C02